MAEATATDFEEFLQKHKIDPAAILKEASTKESADKERFKATLRKVRL